MAASSVLREPRMARRQMAAMGVCYALGTFNDNFFKQAVLLLAATAGMREFQGTATLLFALPFVLFSAWAGWAADRFSKKTLIIIAKAIEVAAMLAGAMGIATLHWGWILLMVFCMGLNSTMFSPALNSSVPELFPTEHVPRVNAAFKLATTATILLGIALAGFALDQNWFDTPWPFGRVLVGAVALLAAVAGLAATLFLIGRPGMGSPNPFPWSGPLGSLRDLGRLRHDAPLLLALLAEAFFYFLSALLILIINDLGGAQLGFSYSATGSLSVALLAGVCAGSFMGARAIPESSHRRPALAMLGVGLCLSLVCAVPLLKPPLNLYFLLSVYVAAGFCGGLYLIPLTSFIQLRPAATDKGRILGLSNFLSFMGILIAGQVFMLLAPLRPSTAHGLLGFMAAAFGLYCLWAGRRNRDARDCRYGCNPDKC